MLSFLCGASAQNLLTNGSFELANRSILGWQLEGSGQWTNDPSSGPSRIRHGRVVSVLGDGNSTSLWRTGPLGLKPGGLYRLSFDLMRERNTTGGSAIAGLQRVNRDFSATGEWKRRSFIFAAPDDVEREFARLGQWNVRGRLLYDDAELLPALALHSRAGAGGEIGEGESIRGGIYQFSPYFGWVGANYHRPLVHNRASFNSDRWVFSRGAEVVYRVGVDGAPQRSATIQANINYYVSGRLIVEASQSGQTWQQVGVFDKMTGAPRIPLPAELFPSEVIWLRLRADGPNPSFQVNMLTYEAPLAKPIADIIGETRFMAVLDQTNDLSVRLLSMQFTDRSQWQVQCMLSNTTSQALTQVRSSIVLANESERASGRIEREGVPTVMPNIAPHATVNLTLTAAATSSAPSTVRIAFRDRTRFSRNRTLFAGETEVSLYFLVDPRPGYWVSDENGLGVWWCESGWKIGRDHGMPPPTPRGRPEPVSVMLAKGEYEPVQVVLRPQRDGELLAARVEGLKDAGGASGSLNVAIDEVAYVPVSQPTDGTGRRALHPDPLPPLKVPLSLRQGQSQPLWLTFHSSYSAAPGDYKGELVLETSFGTQRIPLRPFVYDFALPKETHLRSAFGLGTREINRYHRLSNGSDKQLVFDKYLQNFAEHRISPYSFYDYAPMDIQFPGTGTNKHAEINFSKFDAAAEKWLGPGGFSTFQLHLRGMGGGTFESRALGKLEGFEEGTPEHARLFGDCLGQVERHLRARGWLDKAFTYWFDEPDRKDYEFVVAGMKRLKAAAPGLQRMLTEQPEAELLGNVDIWCGLTPEWTREKVQARRAAGEAVWWYICTGPKAPYVTEFIDHPGTELRLWPWQSWQYGVQGILVWASVYWSSGAAFPAPQLQDPWNDPMSYVSGYSFRPGHVGYWGNGDGRFLYPPRRDPNAATNAILDGPISSIRWENLRDGVEDYEYFWLLETEIARLARRNRGLDILGEARPALQVPADVSADLTHFTDDPRALLAHRDRVARLIERLQKAR